MGFRIFYDIPHNLSSYILIVKMRCFLFSDFEVAKPMASGKRTIYLAKGLKSANPDIEVEIDIVNDYNTTLDNRNKIGIIDGIRYRYVNRSGIPYKNIVRKIYSRLKSGFEVFTFINNNIKQDDIVYCYLHDFIVLIAVIFASKKARAKLVREVVEIPYYYEGSIPQVKRIFDRNIILRLFDGVTCISLELMDYINKYKSKKTKIIKIPVIVNNDDFVKSVSSPFSFPYIIHTGTMLEHKDGISYIIRAFAKFKEYDDSGCKLVFAGPHSVDNCSYIPLMKELKIYDDILLLGMIHNKEELCNLQSHAAMSIVYRFENLQTRYGFSTKMGEILSLETPLVTTPIGGHVEYLKDRFNVFYVNPGDIDQLAIVIDYIITHSSESKQIGLNGKITAEQSFNYAIIGNKLYDFLRSL